MDSLKFYIFTSGLFIIEIESYSVKKKMMEKVAHDLLEDRFCDIIYYTCVISLPHIQASGCDEKS